MINLKRNIIKVLILLVVATFNCCIPTTFASHNGATHQVVQNLDSTNHPNTTSQHCPSQEKPDLDAIHTGSTSVVEEIQEHVSQDYEPKHISYTHKSQATYKQTLYLSSATPILRLWGASSEFSSSVFRL